MKRRLLIWFFQKLGGELHPLGFWKIYLTRRPWPVRVHIWLDGQIANEDPHDHRWGSINRRRRKPGIAFVSLPLLGTFDDRRYLRAPGDDWRLVTCRPDRGDGRMFTDVAPTGLELLAHHIRRPLLPYICRAGAIHSYVPRGRYGVTVVALGRTKAGESNVWRRA